MQAERWRTDKKNYQRETSATDEEEEECWINNQKPNEDSL